MECSQESGRAGYWLGIHTHLNSHSNKLRISKFDVRLPTHRKVGQAVPDKIKKNGMHSMPCN